MRPPTGDTGAPVSHYRSGCAGLSVDAGLGSSLRGPWSKLSPLLSHSTRRRWGVVGGAGSLELRGTLGLSLPSFCFLAIRWAALPCSSALTQIQVDGATQLGTEPRKSRSQNTLSPTHTSDHPR